MSHRVPVEAIRMFEEGKTTREVRQSGVRNFDGELPRPRTVRDWKIYWERGDYIPYAREEDDIIRLDVERPPTFVETEKGAQASAVTKRVHTVEELVEACKIDLKIWQIDRYEVKYYEAPRANVSKALQFDEGRASGYVVDDGDITVESLCSIKLWLSRRQEAAYEEFLKRLPILVGGFTPEKTVAAPLRITGDHAAVVHIYDPHINKRPFNGHSTLEDALITYKKVVTAICGRIRALDADVEQIYFPLGHDFLHTDTFLGTTTTGTPQDIIADPVDAIYTGAQAAVFAVQELSKLAPVEVISIRGNHDSLNTIWLGLFIRSWFRNTDYVVVDASKDLRKYRQYGVTGFGMTHGDRIKQQSLGMIMAVEKPDIWATTTYRIIFLGNLHTKLGMFYQVFEDHGVVLQVIPAICDTDHWHMLSGYVGNKRAAQVDLYHKQHGPAGSFPVFVDEL